MNIVFGTLRKFPTFHPNGSEFIVVQENNFYCSLKPDVLELKTFLILKFLF